MGHLRRVVITGMGVVSSLGESLHSFWEALCAGRSGVGPLTLFDTTEFKVHFGGQIRDWDPVARFGVKEARHLDRFAQFALAAAESAVQDAGIEFSKLPAEQCGVFIGSGIGGLNEFEAQHLTMIHKGPSRISPFMIPKLMVNAGSGQVSIRWGLQGPCSAVATACASASNAIGDAYKLIQSRHADVMITGGSEAAITHMGLGGFAAMRALSTRNDDPKRASRPFDRDRDGFVMGEGAGLLVLEELEHAKQRGAKIYCEIAGYGNTADAHHLTAPSPGGEGAARCMKMALRTAGLNPTDISYINAHGTSTPQGDICETQAIKSVFGEHAKKLAVSSTKGATGHMLGAAGAVEMTACALAIKHGIVPPTINLQNPDPECDLDYVPNTARELKITAVINNSFGFGGHNSTIAAKKFVG